MHPIKDTLLDRVALVTGGGSGIGKASAKLLSFAGAKILVLDRTLEAAENTTREIQSQGGAAQACAADVSQPGQMQEAYQRLEETWGRLDILLANAGINGKWSPLEELELEDWNQTLSINLTGTYLTVKYALPLLKKQGGSVIITASVNGTRMFSNTGATAYACSKAGQVAFAKMSALELARNRIRVNVICPGAIETNINLSTQAVHLEGVRPPVEFPQGFVPLTQGKPGTAGDVADLVWFLASDLSRHITGTEIYIDGAQSLIQG